MKTVRIEGMMCKKCAARAQKALDALGEGAEVILEEKCAKVPDTFEDEAIRKAIADAGYEVVGIE